MENQKKRCHDFVNACLQKRVSPNRFQGLLTTFHDRNPTIPGRDLLNVLVYQPTANGAVDPRAPLYVKEMVRLRVCDLADVLSSLQPPQAEPPADGNGIHYDQTFLEIDSTPKPKLQAMVFQMLIMEVSGGLIKTKPEARATLQALIAWMSLLPGSNTLGYFLSAVLGIPAVQETLSQASSKGNSLVF